MSDEEALRRDALQFLQQHLAPTLDDEETGKGLQGPPWASLCPWAGLLLLRDDKDFQSWDSGTQTLCGPYTADIQSLYSEYTGCADWRMPDFGGKS